MPRQPPCRSPQGDVIKFKTPANPNMLPPGMYMLTILSGRGVPSEAKILSVFSRG